MQEHASILEQQATARAQAQAGNFLDFCCMFEGDTFDEEVLTDKGWLGLCRDETGVLQLCAEFTYDGTEDADGEKMGMGWSIV